MAKLDLSIEKFPIGVSKDWRFGLISRDVYRAGEDAFELTDVSDGWQNAMVNLQTMQDLLNGKQSVIELDWK